MKKVNLLGSFFGVMDIKLGEPVCPHEPARKG